MIASWLVLAATTPLQPSGKWVVNFADKACILSRPYGQGRDAFVLNFKPALVGRAVEIVIAREEQSPRASERLDGWIEKPDGRRVKPVSSQNYSTVGKHRLSRIHIEPEVYRVGEDGERLNLHIGKNQQYDLALPGFAEAMKMLNFCLRDLRKGYGIDEETMAQIATPAEPTTPVYRHFSTGDYPVEALRNDEQGAVGVLYWIEANGRPGKCQIIESSHSRSIDQQTCNVIVGSVRYKPARNAQDKRVRSPDYRRIWWVLP